MTDHGQGFAPQDSLAFPKVTVYVEQYRDWQAAFVPERDLEAEPPPPSRPLTATFMGAGSLDVELGIVSIPSQPVTATFLGAGSLTASLGVQKPGASLPLTVTFEGEGSFSPFIGRLDAGEVWNPVDLSREMLSTAVAVDYTSWNVSREMLSALTEAPDHASWNISREMLSVLTQTGWEHPVDAQMHGTGMFEAEVEVFTPERLFPVQDVTTGTWLNQDDEATNLWASIADVQDDTYIYNDGPSMSEFKFEPGPSGVKQDHFLAYRHWGSIPLTVELVQGAQVIASWQHPAGDPETVSQALTQQQMDAITDYSDLRVRFTA